MRIREASALRRVPCSPWCPKPCDSARPQAYRIPYGRRPPAASPSQLLWWSAGSTLSPSQGSARARSTCRMSPRTLGTGPGTRGNQEGDRGRQRTGRSHIGRTSPSDPGGTPQGSREAGRSGRVSDGPKGGSLGACVPVQVRAASYGGLRGPALAEGPLVPRLGLLGCWSPAV